MEMEPDWLTRLEAWSAQNESVLELWLFGSRAQERSRPDSDVDLALVLKPAIGDHDWALGNYAALGDTWQQELEAIVGRHVSLTLLNDKIAGDTVCLWRRS